MDRRQITKKTFFWNRKLHIYLGLYLLLFVWLFSISGLLLNNRWSFADFWPERTETSFQKSISPPAASGDLEVAEHLMEQLDVRGEINETRWNSSGDQFRAQVIKPGQIVSIDANFAVGRAEVEETRVNTWGIINMLHSFNGVAMNDPNKKRNWLLTRIWSFSMDAVALELVILVFTGLYQWYRLKQKRIPGLIALGFGMVSCGFFVFGFARLF